MSIVLHASNSDAVHGTNAATLIEKILRQKIYNSLFWKEKCFGLTAESLVDEAVHLKCIGGTYGGSRKPCNFICLILKMLRIQPEREIVLEFIRNEDYKYVRILGAVYLRLTAKSLDIYNYLEPLLNDYRKIRRRNIDGTIELTHVDEVVDDLLREDRVFDTILPHLVARHQLVEQGVMGPRQSVLEDLIVEQAKNEEGDKKRKNQEDNTTHRVIEGETTRKKRKENESL